MHIRRVFLVMFLWVLSLLCFAQTGVAQTGSASKVVVDKVVANVGESYILYSEVQEAAEHIREQRRAEGYTPDRDAFNEALEQLLTMKLLYSQGVVDSVEINKESIRGMVDNEINQLVEKHGSVAALEAFFHQPIFDVRRSLNKRYEEMSYAQSMRGRIGSDITITPGEVERFYANSPADSLPIIPEQYVYAQITKLPPSTQVAKQRVKERLLEMRKRVIDGTSFGLLARMYSEDPGSATRGGEMEPLPKESFAAPFAAALERLRPGQISEVVETEFGFHIIELIDKKGNMYHARHILLRPQFTSEELMASNKLLDSIATQIRSGSITFEKAALEHSDDRHSKQNGGLVSNYEQLELYQAFDAKLTTTKFYKEDIPTPDYVTLRDLKPGEISSSFTSSDMRGNMMGKIVKLVSVIPSHRANLNEDYLTIEEAAMAKKKEAEFFRWMEQTISKMFIRIDPQYREGDFQFNWVK